MLSVTTGTVVFGTPFTISIDVFSEEVDPETGETTTTAGTEVPVVTKSFDDPGVTVTAEIGKVTIAGTYRKIIVTSWDYLDLNGELKTVQVTPEIGTFTKITKVDSPAKLKEDCVYTIDGETFTHTVDLGSYTVVADTLKQLLKTVK